MYTAGIIQIPPPFLIPPPPPFVSFKSEGLFFEKNDIPLFCLSRCYSFSPLRKPETQPKEGVGVISMIRTVSKSNWSTTEYTLNCPLGGKVFLFDKKYVSLRWFLLTIQFCSWVN